MVKLILVWALAALFTASGIYTTLSTNATFGTFLVWAGSVALIVYGFFHKPIDAFLAQGFGRVVKYTLVAGLLVLGGMFLFVAVSGYANTAKGNEKAIVVLGAGLRGEAPGGVLRRRLDVAYEAWQQNPETLVVVTGGQGSTEVIPEAVAMQRYLVQRGMPAERIVVEDKSTSTEENLQFAKALLAERGVDETQPIAVATNAFHCYRAAQYAGKAGFADVHTIPAGMPFGVVLQSYLREIFAIFYFWVFRR